MNPNYPLLCSLWPLLGIDGGAVEGPLWFLHRSIRRPDQNIYEFCCSSPLLQRGAIGLLFTFAVVITDDGTVV